MRKNFHQDHDGGAVLDLRCAAARRAIHLPDLPELSPEARQMAIRTWRGRMINEHISAQVWSALVGQLLRAAIPPELLAGVAEAVSDELRHAELCAAVVEALGGTAVARLPPIEDVPDHSDVGALEGVLRNVISVGCMSETVAVAVIRTEQAELDGTALGEVLSSILADEVSHARLGWKLLGACAPLLDAGTKQRLSAYLVDALAHQIEHEVPMLPILGAVDPNAAAAGVCDGGFARSVFLDTIEQVIVPGLERAGLSASEAWARAQARTASLLVA
ncbi:MAG: hypothetical protein CL927_12455 [Deltaproteobacteria bacterium]|nr:hypothetical protein [Deltaproteobacteria bacterium]HCH61251.1 hypothetical protein [Deltaproteobacteria bacterium]